MSFSVSLAIAFEDKTGTHPDTPFGGVVFTVFAVIGHDGLARGNPTDPDLRRGRSGPSARRHPTRDVRHLRRQCGAAGAVHLRGPVGGQAGAANGARHRRLDGGLGVVLTGIYIVGVIVRPRRTRWRMGPDSIAAIVVYALGIAGLFLVS